MNVSPGKDLEFAVFLLVEVQKKTQNKNKKKPKKKNKTLSPKPPKTQRKQTVVLMRRCMTITKAFVLGNTPSQAVYGTLKFSFAL